MTVAVYDPLRHIYTEGDGTVHKFFHSITDNTFPDEAMTLIRFKQGSLTLQEAYTCLLNLARVPKSKFSYSEFSGDLCIVFGADTFEGLQKLQNVNNQEIKID
jgi:hypothetical protein